MSISEPRPARKGADLRAAIVLSLLCAIAGGVMFYSGSTRAEAWRKLQEREWDRDKPDSIEFKTCLEAADNGDGVDVCYQAYRANPAVLRRNQGFIDRAEFMGSIGLFLCLLPVPIFAALFLYRWIVNGSFRA
jgi:hypothetical protein